MTVWMPVCAGAQETQADTVGIQDTLAVEPLQAPALQVQKRPWKALGEGMMASGVIHCVGRFILNEKFSQTNLSTIRDNLKSGFAWDDDVFYINQLGHAYQGGLYFSAARSNGMSFLESVPYTTVNSLIWEFVGEKEQPSINDMITTTFSGTIMGEISYRLADHIFDDRASGGERVVREIVATVINPFEGAHRLFSGRMWKVRNDVGGGNPGDERRRENLVRCGVQVGDRYLSTSGIASNGRHQPVIGVDVEYGQIADGEKHLSPFDYFTVDGTLAFGREQKPVANFNLMGRICSTPVLSMEKANGELGLYQYFYYEDTHLPGDSTKGAFPYGEMASLGPGLSFSVPQLAPGIALQQHFNARMVLLGAVNSDYYKFYNRTYNMGSGYGIASSTRASWENVGEMRLKAYFMHLFTWRGYEPRDLSNLVFDDSNYLNVLGDKSDARVFSVTMQLMANLTRRCGLFVGASYFSRHTHYKFHPWRHTESCELRAGLEWRL